MRVDVAGGASGERKGLEPLLPVLPPVGIPVEIEKRQKSDTHKMSRGSIPL